MSRRYLRSANICFSPGAYRRTLWKKRHLKGICWNCRNINRGWRGCFVGVKWGGGVTCCFLFLVFSLVFLFFFWSWGCWDWTCGWPGKAELSEWNCTAFIPAESADRLNGLKVSESADSTHPSSPIGGLRSDSVAVKAVQFWWSFPLVWGLFFSNPVLS